MLIAFYKPFGVLSRFTTDGSPQRTLAEFGFPKKVYPIGRLDADSEGLLLLSDEPALNELLLHPRHAHEREYWAQVERIPTMEALQNLSQGVVVQGRRTLPCRAWQLDPQPVVAGAGLSMFTTSNRPSAVCHSQSRAFSRGEKDQGEQFAPQIPPRDPPIRFRKSVSDCWIGLELVEGKNRQVRRMTAAIGHPTLRLIRVRIGGLRLGNLRVGEWCQLSREERREILRSGDGRQIKKPGLEPGLQQLKLRETYGSTCAGEI